MDTKLNSGIERLSLVRNQLATTAQKDIINFHSAKNPLNKWRKKSKVDKNIIDDLYHPYHKDLRDNIYKIIQSNPIFKHPYQTEMNMDEYRLVCVKQMKTLLDSLNKFSSFKEIRLEPKKFYTFMECINSFDMGMAVKFGVHSVLYYNCLKNLSTSQHQIYMERALTFEDIGCFALTEFGHGSNVRDIKLTATYDEKNQEFILHSPNFDAYKWWIGGAAKSANMACVFAQLYVKGIAQGVHCFLVNIRDKATHLPFPGVIIGDCGPKVGNEVIDNGFIGFNNYRIPREGLLDRYSSVSEDGNFSSPITNPDTRFATVLGALEEGRITIGAGSQTVLRNCLTVATRYAALRKQFGKEENEEIAILNYPTTQMRLIPALAEHFAYRFGSIDLMQRWLDAQPFLSDPKNDQIVELHAILSVLKPLTTNQSQARIQQTREILGGHGYSRFNKIGGWRNDNDINITWEGDNTVLIQQAARFIAKSLQKKMKGKEVKHKSLAFLARFEEVSSAKANVNSQADLQNLDNLIGMLEFRVNLLLQKSVGRLAEKVGTKKSAFEAWNDTQVFYLQNMARAWGELYAFNCFRDKINSITDSPTKKVLVKLLCLYALVQLERDMVYLRENDYINSEACDLIRNEILDLNDHLKDHAVTVIDAISPPDEIIGAPLGNSDGKIFDRYLNMVFMHPKTFERADWWEILHHKKI